MYLNITEISGPGALAGEHAEISVSGFWGGPWALGRKMVPQAHKNGKHIFSDLKKNSIFYIKNRIFYIKNLGSGPPRPMGQGPWGLGRKKGPRLGFYRFFYKILVKTLYK